MVVKVGRKPKQTDECICGHLFEEHDWGLTARRENQAGCLVLGKKNALCPCDNFRLKPKGKTG